MDRRNFIKSSCTFCLAATGVAAITTLLESCGTMHVFNGSINDNSITIPIAELTEKDSLIVKAKNTSADIALIKMKSGEWKAILMLCTHASNPVTFYGSGFRCNVHFSEFNLAGVPQSGPAQKPLKVLTTEQTADSIVVRLL
ncbi:MAG: Rieske 2Fe-2S domain-containing protein [Bacteroidetes bacterium]|nr:Rieske 2Fe-2S domain-containing protein [Bacteroidota bacterium]